MQILIGSTLWAGCFIVPKLYVIHVPPLVLVWYVAFISTLFALVLRKRSPASLWPVFRQNFGDAVGVAIFGMVLGNALLYYSVRHLDLVVCSLLERIQPVLVVGLSHLWLKERLSPQEARYCMIAFFGAVLLVIKDPSSITIDTLNVWGVVAALGMALSWALSTIFGKKLSNRGVAPLDISALRFLIGTLALAPLLPLVHETVDLYPSFALLGAAAAIAMFSVGGFLFYYAGLRWVSAGRSTFLEPTQSLVCVLLGVLVLGEVLTTWQMIAIPVLIFAVTRLAQVEAGAS